MPMPFERPEPAGKILLSLIIPVYNVEKYIEACLDSVFRQIPAEGVEIILVDDGSPDGSMDIVRSSYARWIDDGTLIALEQPNKGPGSARNL
jgi:glycosyltransferase involved in cell wall biosynthesis